MINFDSVTTENMKQHNPNWQKNSCLFIHGLIDGSGPRKTNVLLNFINLQPHINKILLFIWNLFEAKYQLLITKHKKTVQKHFTDPDIFIEYSNNMNDF